MMPIAQAGTKCEPVSGGGICCWDVDKEGIFKPISCAWLFLIFPTHRQSITIGWAVGIVDTLVSEA